ncbi:MAG: alkyl sulfatase dimerization domain-containing protein [Pseudomonadales bacterium]|jgi:alkyl sulfatase BDS1-like metallo-beta-lactamase superfamily hydrolase|tara:strand:- start:75 stop:2015 length:1941 start_codon:yes stop_codon:yes gene_type:complete
MTDYQALPKEFISPKPATEATKKINQGFINKLDFTDRRSFDNAKKGFIATLNPITIAHDSGSRAAFDLEGLSFLNDEPAETVNPSLWRQAQLNALNHGLYEVVPGIYQIRSFDIANMTLIKSDSGWIIIDPLTSTEASRTGLALANKELGERPVVAVIITHSHADHFAGILGVMSHEDAESGKVAMIAPEHFVNEALSENVLAGNVMSRRATYMYGNLLPSSPTGFVTTGLGAALSMGNTGFIIPNDLIKETGETRHIDGVDIEFQMTPGSEAPAEMVFYFPQFKALCMSEITSHHLHNLYTPRGAQVRDALAWAAQINESIDLFGDRLEVEFASHHWPIWGRQEAIEYLKKQRDMYKYIHDQTLRLANHGYIKEEIAEQIKLPESLGKEFYNRDYYGTVHHNARAVYVKYLGFFDGNPATLFPLPPTEVATRYLEFMGGADAIVEKARGCFDAGDYRWVAEVLNHVVMAEPDHFNARALQADTLEQLGYQSESGPWRNFYLCGALELRQGLPKGAAFGATASMAKSMPLENLYQTMAVRLNGPSADGLVIHLNLDFTDSEPTLLSIENAVLHAFTGKQHQKPNATLRMSAVNFKFMMTGNTDAMKLLESGELEMSGDFEALGKFRELFDQFERRFPIVTPRKPWA